MRTRVFVLLLLFILILVGIAINYKSIIKQVSVEDPEMEIAFDQSKWNVKDGIAFPHRNAMLKSLMSDPEIRSKKKDEIINLLGEPTKVNGDYVYYRIDQKKALLLTMHTKTLVIHFNPDGSVEWMKIHE